MEREINNIVDLVVNNQPLPNSMIGTREGPGLHDNNFVSASAGLVDVHVSLSQEVPNARSQQKWKRVVPKIAVQNTKNISSSHARKKRAMQTVLILSWP